MSTHEPYLTVTQLSESSWRASSELGYFHGATEDEARSKARRAREAGDDNDGEKWGPQDREVGS